MATGRFATKRRRLESLTGVLGITSKKLHEVLQIVQRLPNDVDLNVSRATLERLHHDIANEARFHYEVLDLEAGPAFNSGPFHWYKKKYPTPRSALPPRLSPLLLMCSCFCCGFTCSLHMWMGLRYDVFVIFWASVTAFTSEKFHPRKQMRQCEHWFVKGWQRRLNQCCNWNTMKK